MRRTVSIGLALSVLAISATAAQTASAATLTLSDVEGVLPTGYSFLLYGEDNVFIHTSAETSNAPANLGGRPACR